MRRWRLKRRIKRARKHPLEIAPETEEELTSDEPEPGDDDEWFDGTYRETPPRS